MQNHTGEIHTYAKDVEQVFQRVVTKTATCATIKSQLYLCTNPVTTVLTQLEK